VMCVICVLCLIVVPLPPGKNPFAVKIIIIIFRRNQTIAKHIISNHMLLYYYKQICFVHNNKMNCVHVLFN
jgi:hypothetical protein